MMRRVIPARLLAGLAGTVLLALGLAVAVRQISRSAARPASSRRATAGALVSRNAPAEPGSLAVALDGLDAGSVASLADLPRARLSDLPADVLTPGGARLLADYRSGPARVIALEAPLDIPALAAWARAAYARAGWQEEPAPDALRGHTILVERKPGLTLVLTISPGRHPGTSGVGMVLGEEPTNATPGNAGPDLRSWAHTPKEERP